MERVSLEQESKIMGFKTEVWVLQKLLVASRCPYYNHLILEDTQTMGACPLKAMKSHAAAQSTRHEPGQREQGAWEAAGFSGQDADRVAVRQAFCVSEAASIVTALAKIGFNYACSAVPLPLCRHEMDKLNSSQRLDLNLEKGCVHKTFLAGHWASWIVLSCVQASNLVRGS